MDTSAPGSGSPMPRPGRPKYKLKKLSPPASTSETTQPVQAALTPAKSISDIPYEIVPIRYQSLEWSLWPDYYLWRYYDFVPPESPTKKRLRNFLFEKYKPDVLRLARSYVSHKMPAYSLADREDVEQDALLALAERIDTYDYRFGTTFMQYINAGGQSIVMGAIKDGLRRLQDCTRLIALKRREMRPRMDSLSQTLGRHITIDDFYDHYGERGNEVLEDRLFWTGVFNQYSERNQETGEVQEVIQAKADYRTASEDDYLSRQDVMSAVLDLFEDDKVRFVVMAYYWMNWIHKSIADALGVSLASVNAMHDKAKRIIREYGEEKFRDLVNR